MDKKMDERRRQRAELYAQLASIESLDTLEEWKQLKLVADAKRGGYALLTLAAQLHWDREHPGEAKLPKRKEFVEASQRDPEKAWRILQPYFPVPRTRQFGLHWTNLAGDAEEGKNLP